MSKNTNLSFLTDYITADITNGRIGINNASPTVAFDVVGVAKFSSSVTATSFNATTTNIFSVDGSEKMRITSAGNVGIGTTSPSVNANQTSLTINGINVSRLDMQVSGTRNAGFVVASDAAYLETTAAIPLVFYTNSSERMRITSGGDVLISNTDGNGKLVIGGDDNNYILRSRNTSAGGNYQFYIQHSLANVSMGNQRGTVAYNNSSDYRLKEDLKEFNGLDILSSINFYDFKWKQNQIRNYGVIAHELQEILPYVVEGKKDELFEDGSVKSQQVDITKLVPILGKAIQELSAKVSLLENK